ncbi:antitoxin Xre/MbcA/ParS toxin-binding domain-containing protein [Pseudomarimonas arenosa]|uniref:antitoxin Xre/MbcA/ParS toxin-binding domain-containing protein n=1 Tax=Pseudomarimonas arenosa TaxID=2774145 RepID=UPI002FC30DFD
MNLPSAPYLARSALTAFFRLAQAWRLDDNEAKALLGHPDQRTFEHWRHSALDAVSADTLTRISYLLGIYRSLNTLFEQPTQADEWVRRPNSGSLFQGASALEFMLSGDISALSRVREYLDHETA